MPVFIEVGRGNGERFEAGVKVPCLLKRAVPVSEQNGHASPAPVADCEIQVAIAIKVRNSNSGWIESCCIICEVPKCPVSLSEQDGDAVADTGHRDIQISVTIKVTHSRDGWNSARRKHRG